VFVSEFKREDRFIVLKRTDLEVLNRFQKAALAVALEEIEDHLPARQYVVVESDWPEYEIVWNMIQARVEGKPNCIAALEAENATLRVSRDAALSREKEANRDWSTEAKRWEQERKKLQTELTTLEAAISEMTTDPCGEYYTGLRCGVEDRDIVCRYEAAEYGWQQAFEYIGSIAAGYPVEG